jgi:hypothetical protein
MFRAELGSFQRLACGNITGTLAMVPMATLEVSFSLLPPSLADARISASRHNGTGMWSDKDKTWGMPGIGMGPCFQMGLEKL